MPGQKQLRDKPICRNLASCYLAVVVRLLALLVLAIRGDKGVARAIPLFDAIAAGDKAAVEQALAGGADVDSRAPDQATPLIAAALDDQLAIAELLLSKGADVMARNSGGFTPLHAAAFSGSLPIAKLLLEKGAVLEDCGQQVGRHAAHRGGRGKPR